MSRLLFSFLVLVGFASSARAAKPNTTRQHDRFLLLGQWRSVCGAPVISTDFFPTILELAGLPSAPTLHADGISLVPYLRGEPVPSRSLYWHYPHYHGSDWTPGAAIRNCDWKLIEFYETDQTELYNLADDIGEKNDLTNSHGEVRDRLKAKLLEWQQKMKAKMPVEIASVD